LKNKNRIIYIFLFILTLVLISACSPIRVTLRKYFLLEYIPHNEDKSLYAENQYDFGVLVSDAKVSSTYNRREIVVKLSDNQIMFDSENLWAVRLPNAISGIIYERISRYRIFNRVERDYQHNAKYEISTNVDAIEFLKYGSIYGARLKMEIQLKRTSDNMLLFHHSSDKSKQIYINDKELFAQTINDMIMEETNIFLKTLLLNIEEIENNPNFSGRLITSKEFIETDKVNFVVDDFEEEIDYVSDINFYGRLILPSLTDPDHEPAYYVEDLQGNFITSQQMGTESHLPPGEYNILIGSGAMSQKVVEKVEIFQRYKTTLEPDIGWLTVNIIDSSRNQVDLRYEIFDNETAESFGFGFGIKEGVGQQLETWLLRPGHYKIVLNNYSFNTYDDFITVDIKKGSLEQITIVVNEEPPYKLLGGGKMLQENVTLAQGTTNLSIINHLNANLTSKNEYEENKNVSSLQVIEQLDTKLVLDYFPYHYTMKNLIEIGVTKETDSNLKVSQDKFDLKNTLIYYFYKNLGLYGRADLSTHLFDEYLHTKEKKYYKKTDRDGNDVYAEYTDKFPFKKPFSPITLKEGLGMNLRVFNQNRATLNIRAGLGFRQDFNKDFYTHSWTDTTGVIKPVEVYTEIDDMYQKGTELSANGNFQILRNLNYTLNGDILIPFDQSETSTFELENLLNLRMFKYISWDYKLYLEYNKNLRDYLLVDHTLYLRFTYIFIK
jgi:ABC-type uncharacterized transport system auxiliary subunit